MKNIFEQGYFDSVELTKESLLTGEFVMVKITRARTWYLNGELI